MSVVPYLREFVNERLTAAAEEIFGIFTKAIVEYEEEIQRQRTLLNIVWKPDVKLQRIELPQQHVCKEEEVLSDHLVRNSSLDQEDPKPLQNREQEERRTCEEEVQLELKQETDDFQFPTYEEMYQDQTLNSHKSHEAERKNLKRGKHGDSGSTSAEPKQKFQHHKSKFDNKHVYNPTKSSIHCNSQTGKKVFKCDGCEKAFKYKSDLLRHRIIHTDEKPYPCKICGKHFRSSNHLRVHMRTHSDERPHLCKTCGNSFREVAALNRHTIIHTGEKPHTCKVCGKAFRLRDFLKSHMKSHTEKPYLCKTCGKRFRFLASFQSHKRTHTRKKPYFCQK